MTHYWNEWPNIAMNDPILILMTQCWHLWHNVETNDPMLKLMTQYWNNDPMLKLLTQCWNKWLNKWKHIRIDYTQLDFS